METKNLLFRPLEPADAAALFSLTSDERVARYMRFDTHHSLRQTEELVAEYNAPENRGFLILSKPSGHLVGLFALKADQEEPGTYSLTTFTAPSYWNRGYATEALQVMLPYAREILNAKALTAYVVERNTGSRRVLEKSGFSVFHRLEFPDLEGGLLVYRLRLTEG